MAVHRAVDLSRLVKELNRLDSEATKALATTLNETGEDVTKKAIDEIINRVELSRQYVADHLYVDEKATPTNLKTVISATARGTLLTRYPNTPYSKGEGNRGGTSVKINKAGGSHKLEGAFRIKLKFGSKSGDNEGIAMRLKDALSFFEANINKGERTSPKQAKLAKMRSDALSRPNKLHVLHSRSVNQLFTSVRDEQTDDTINALAETFFEKLFKA